MVILEFAFFSPDGAKWKGWTRVKQVILLYTGQES
jgi:hypothetical protein